MGGGEAGEREEPERRARFPKMKMCGMVSGMAARKNHVVAVGSGDELRLRIITHYGMKNASVAALELRSTPKLPPPKVRCVTTVAPPS